MKKILIGISGSIAAYKTVLLIRELSQSGYAVRVILTSGGQRFVTKKLIAGLGVEVYTDDTIKLDKPEEAMLHINLAKWADLIMIAPASANTIAKLATGLADSLLYESVLAASNKAIYLAPAMNYQMYKNPATQANLQILAGRGINICEPNEGIQACGDVGLGRMQEANQLQQIIENHFRHKELANLRDRIIVITLGATIEAIDPVRFISNHSSGKMGLALINAALDAGAKVIAIYGKIDVTLPENSPSFTKIPALSATEMLNVTLEQAKTADILIACAAICDYRMKEISKEKIKKNSANNAITLELIPNPDIVAEAKKATPSLLCIGFAAETENLIDHAKVKLEKKNLDIIVANPVDNGKAFGKDNNEIHILDKKGNISQYTETSKNILATNIMIYLDKYHETE
ncbi:bifunctional phosphopantothenoylcysteine decarboxylase/phosphopantothenate--cysteine ligase CoaBC [Aquella oligotrophica]|uniref:Coenzyme A biosynthesis bifunctional protein CoaBC n=1 Tax=Aquella oligotrophica TaxID=2067065 RepID=A0A2I7N6M0_9NEIS|nr:bifunctional phosphopantothenoylcysteine decarboxylase/phosphopantothenate--cysteine ligase CoaBC [Aquella oligotrophica]AUR52126.1 bifunctional phosphopantothenoylcysteine decarboxylase/phosphopantothenate--cysteine ligase CoaBC [Aquella oligotrophica]